MKKAKKKTKVPQRPTELDRIVTQLRTMLRRDTTSVIEKGKLLLRSRELHADEHGEWQGWLEKNFDLSIRTAQNYCAAAEYVARKSATVADFANLAPSVLYRLAAGHFDERVEAAILAEARKRRIDEDAMWAIRDRLAPPDDDDADDADDQEDGGEDSKKDGGEDGGEDSSDEEDAESEKILDGPPPKVPPPADPTPPTDFALRDFDEAISALNQLKTKLPARFAEKTTHSAKVLESVEAFIHAVTKASAPPGVVPPSREQELENKTRTQEITIEGLRSEIEELREKLAKLDDKAVP